MGRTLLLGSGLPKSFWSFSFIWACYVLNRIPNGSSGDVTPYEKFFGTKPSFELTRVFGDQAYVHIDAEKRKKLDKRASPGYVVAMLPESKGWCFWLPQLNAFVNSNVATFRHHPKPSHISSPHFSLAEMAMPSIGDFRDELTADEQDRMVERITSSVPEFSAVGIPNTYRQAMKSPEKEAWLTAVKEELANLDRLGVWEVLPVPPGVKVMSAKWVFAKKYKSDGTIDRFKARYVARGYSQIAGIQYSETFAPTATFISMRLLLSYAAANGWPVHSFDFVAAYLNSPIDEDLWVTPPEALDSPAGTACHLKKALYGTKQAARCWWRHLAGTLSNMGCKASKYDSSLYLLEHGSGGGSIWVHVDDGIVTAPTELVLKKLQEDLSAVLQIKWESSLTDIVGLSVVRDDSGFVLSQPKLISKILAEHWDGVTTSKTPLPTGNLPVTAGDEEGIDASGYLSLVGMLSYLAVGTRPDICFSVNFLARFSKRPTTAHWAGAKTLVNYLAATKDQPLLLYPKTSSPHLLSYVDANWGGEFSRSTYGLIIFHLGCPIAWISKRLATVAASTAHAEYMALGHCTRQVLWIRNLLFDIYGVWFIGKILCDNQATVKISSNDTSNKRVRHTDREFYITNQAFKENKISVEWVSTKHQFADIFTKNLSAPIHKLQQTVVLGVSSSGGVL
jgi:hypothetical protein